MTNKLNEFENTRKNNLLTLNLFFIFFHFFLLSNLFSLHFPSKFPRAKPRFN